MLRYRSTWEFVRTLEKCGEALRCTLCFSTLLLCSYKFPHASIHLNISCRQVLYFSINLSIKYFLHVKSINTKEDWTVVCHLSTFTIFWFPNCLQWANQKLHRSYAKRHVLIFIIHKHEWNRYSLHHMKEYPQISNFLQIFEGWQ